MRAVTPPTEVLCSIRAARRSLIGLACVGACLFGLLASGSAMADIYKVTQGTLSDADGDRTEPLDGRLEVSRCDDCFVMDNLLTTLWVDSFLLRSGDAIFEPVRPIEFEGMRPLLGRVYRKSGIQLLDDQVETVFLSAGGFRVAADEERVTFRFYDFLGDGSGRGRVARGGGRPGRLPRSLDLEGTLYAYHETYGIAVDRCFVTISLPDGLELPAPGGPGSGVTITAVEPGVILERPVFPTRPVVVDSPGIVAVRPDPGGPDGGAVFIIQDSPAGLVVDDGERFHGRPLEPIGGPAIARSAVTSRRGRVPIHRVLRSRPVFRSFPEFDLGEISEPVAIFQPPGSSGSVVNPGGSVFARPIGADSNLIVGDLVEAPGALVERFEPEPSDFRPIPDTGIPSLADLGITAPDGAEVTVDEGGVLRIESEGALYLDGFDLQIPWLTQVVIIAGSIFVSGDLNFGPDVSVTLETWALPADPPSDDGLVIYVPPTDPEIAIGPACLYLIARSARQEVGFFSLLASRFQPVEIDVWPGKKRKRIRLGSGRRIKVAVLGSEDLNVREIKRHSLRLGPDEASAKSRRWSGRKRYRDVNRDGYRDLVVRFDLMKTGIAPGDTEVCLTGELRDGTLIEGCDEIETRSRRRPHRPKR